MSAQNQQEVHYLTPPWVVEPTLFSVEQAIELFEEAIKLSDDMKGSGGWG